MYNSPYNDLGISKSVFLAETERRLGGVVAKVYDTSRSTSLPCSFEGDTLRFTGVQYDFGADTFRHVNGGYAFLLDTQRKTGIPQFYYADSLRALGSLLRSNSDTLRELAPTLIYTENDSLLPLGWLISGGLLPKFALRGYSEFIPEHDGEYEFGFDRDVDNLTLTLVSPHSIDKESLRQELMYMFQNSWAVRKIIIYDREYYFRLNGRIEIKNFPHNIVAEIPIVLWKESTAHG